MIFTMVINLFAIIIGIVLSWLPNVTTLPSLLGFDIDAALVSGVGDFKAFITYFWPIRDVWYGFWVLVGYFTIKMVLKFFLGHRAPGKH